MSDHSHEIMVVKQHPSGAEEWFCPTCGRRFLVHWSPQYQCVVLNVGDESAIHNMGKGALVVLGPKDIIEEERLAPWIEWLSQSDISTQLGEEQDLN
jgi:hypothetical protein